MLSTIAAFMMNFGAELITASFFYSVPYRGTMFLELVNITGLL